MVYKAILKPVWSYAVESNPETYLVLWCTNLSWNLSRAMVYKAILKIVWNYGVQSSPETCPELWCTKQSWNLSRTMVYKVILKPIWNYGVQLWGSASNSNVEILERFQSKVLRIITDASWCVPNVLIIHDLNVLSDRSEVRDYSATCRQGLNRSPPTNWQNLYLKTKLHS